MNHARLSLARHVRHSMSQAHTITAPGVPLFPMPPKHAEAKVLKATRIAAQTAAKTATAHRVPPPFTLQVDHEQLVAMRLYARKGRCH